MTVSSWVMVTRFGFPWIHPSAIRLSLVPWPRILSVNWGVEGGDAGGRLSSLAFTRFPESWSPLHSPRLQSLRRWPVDPHCQHRGYPSCWQCLALAGTPVNSCRLAVGPAAGLAASNFRAWFKASFRVQSPPIKSCCFTSWSRTLLKAWAACVWIKGMVSLTRAQCGSCSTAAANSCNISPLPCTLALSCDR